jgi:hypothetical protein
MTMSLERLVKKAAMLVIYSCFLLNTGNPQALR